VLAYSGQGMAGWLCSGPSREDLVTGMTTKTKSEPVRIPEDRLSIEQRSDGAVVVRVQSEGPEGSRLPDAVFSFRCGDPQYAYWLDRLRSHRG